MTKAALYCRVSSRGQEQDGTSLDTQLASCVRFAAEQGYTVDEDHIYREVHTGTELWERPRMRELREAIKRKTVDAVVCHAIDRMSRDPVHLGVILSEADNAGVVVHFVTESIDNTPEGQLIRFVRGYAGKVEHEKFRERAQRGKRARVASGKPLAGPRPLYGHKWCDDDKSALLPDEVTALVVQRIYAEYLAGRSLRSIGLGLAAEGIPSPMNLDFWNITTIRYILANPAYTGKAVAWQYRYTRQQGGRWTRELRDDADRVTLPEGTIQPLIALADFDAVQRLLTENKSRLGGRAPRDPEATLLRGIARCGFCGRKMRVKWQKEGKKQVATYSCSTRDRCPGPEFTVRSAIIDHEIWAALMYRLDHPEMLGAELRQLAEEDPTELDLAPIERNLAAAAREQTNLLAGLAAADLPAVRDAIVSSLTAVENRKQGLQAERERLLARQAEWQRAQEQLAGVEAWCREAAATISAAGFERRRELLHLLDARLQVYPRGHEPRWILEAWLPAYASEAEDATWRRETMRADDQMPSANTVQMKVCIFQGWEDDDNPEIIATFYTDPEGNVHVDNEAFYDTVRGIVSGATGRRTDGHDGIAFLHAVRAYFPGPHIWAGEVVPLFPKTTAED